MRRVKKALGQMEVRDKSCHRGICAATGKPFYKPLSCHAFQRSVTGAGLD
jgi:hypothetical protein